MRIGLELFGTQTASRHRGIGRYCRNLTHALLSAGRAAGHEFALYTAEGLPTDQIPAPLHALSRRLRPEPTMGNTVARLVRGNPDGLDVLVFLNPLELHSGHDIPSRPVFGGPKLM